MLLTNGRQTTITECDLDIQERIKPGIISLAATNKGIIVHETTTEPYPLPKKIYGDPKKRMKRIFKAWESRGKNTGVLLSGLKGSGKSLLLKMCCNRGLKQELPVFIIDSAVGIGAKFEVLRKVEQRGIILFDEFEKTFSDPHAQAECLSFLDGLDSSNFLILFSVNTLRINENLLHRPGRIYYHYNYTGLQGDVIEEILEDNLKDEDQIDDTLDALETVEDVSFDVVTSLVHEMNTFKCDAYTALRHLNINSQVKTLGVCDMSTEDEERLKKLRKVEKLLAELNEEPKRKGRKSKRRGRYAEYASLTGGRKRTRHHDGPSPFPHGVIICSDV